MRSHLPAVIVLLCSCLFFSGCDSGPATIPVKGNVSFDGKALTSGTVTFKPDAVKGNKAVEMPVGSIGSDGGYSLATGNKVGAPAGWYKVVVTSTTPSNPADPYSLPRSLIPPKYTQPNDTDLSVEVKADVAAGAYDLKLAP